MVTISIVLVTLFFLPKLVTHFVNYSNDGLKKFFEMSKINIMYYNLNPFVRLL